MKRLDILATIKDGVSLALLNYLSVVCTVILYVLTVWIPYLNVGTTIAMASLPAEMAKGNVINPTFIFDSKYRRNMGEFFILMALMMGAVWVGIAFGFIPGIVISYAWYLAVILFIDRDMAPLDALRESNRLTYGNKWRIFCAEMLLTLCLCIAVAVVNALFHIGDVAMLKVIGVILVFLLVIFAVPALIGVEAAVYKALAFPADQPATDQPTADQPAADKTAADQPAAE